MRDRSPSGPSVRARGVSRGSVWAAVLGAMLLLLGFGKPAFAIPSFAYQTGLNCAACHFQQFPKLTAFGRWFKANGYSYAQPSPNASSSLYVPLASHVSVELQASYQDQSGPLATPGQSSFDGSIMYGGRLAPGIGGFTEFSNGLAKGKVSFTHALGPVTLGITPFSTPEDGPGFGFDLLNTGFTGILTPFLGGAPEVDGDNSSYAFTQGATGIAIHAFNPSWFLAYSRFAPFSAPGLAQVIGMNWSNSLRAAYTPEIGSWDCGFGGGSLFGATELATSSLDTNAYFVDAQAQGRVADRDLGLYAMYALGDVPSTGPSTNMFGGTVSRPQSLSLSGEYSLLPNFGLLANYGYVDPGNGIAAVFDEYALGLDYKPFADIQVVPTFTYYSGPGRPVTDRSLVTLWSMF